MLEIKNKIDFFSLWKDELALTDPEGIGFNEEDNVFYEKNGGIYTFRIDDKGVYDVCVVSLGPHFYRGFKQFSSYLYSKFNSIEIACNPDSSVERYLLANEFSFLGKLKDNRNVYLWRK